MKTRHSLIAAGVAGLAIAAASVATALVAGAAIPDDDGTIRGCYLTFNGALRVIDAESGETCRSQEGEISWNQAGVPGPQGVQGQQGVQGEQGPPGDGGMPTVYFASGTGGASDQAAFTLSVPNVPPGSYVAEAQISAWDHPSWLTCSIGATERLLKLNFDPHAPSGDLHTIFGTLEMTSAFEQTFSGSVSLTCSTRFAPSVETIVNANLTVTEVASVN